MIEATAAPRWATVAEASAYLDGKVSQRTLRRWIQNGTLTGSTRLGPRKIQVDLNELDRLRIPIQRQPPPNGSE